MLIYKTLMILKNLLLVVIGVLIGVLFSVLVFSSRNKNKRFYIILISLCTTFSLLLSVNISMPS